MARFNVSLFSPGEREGRISGNVSEKRRGAPNSRDLDADAYSVREVARSREGGVHGRLAASTVPRFVRTAKLT